MYETRRESAQDGWSEQSVGKGQRLYTHRPLCSSCLGLPYRILSLDHKKELLRGLWVELNSGWTGKPLPIMIAAGLGLEAFRESKNLQRKPTLNPKP